MSGLNRELGFHCHVCTGQVFLVVHCSIGGEAIHPRVNTRTACDVRCPNCGSANHVIFDALTGDVLEVEPMEVGQTLETVPSLN